MSWSSALFAVSALSAISSAVPTTRSAKHVVDLARANTSPASSRSLLYNRATNTARLSSVEDGSGYAVPITFGSQNFNVLFDTGSSDLWLPASNFQCLNANGKAATGQCKLGDRYQGSFTGGSIPNENFNISYGDGEFLIGTLGYETVSLAGLKVPKQEAALVTTGYFNGDGQTNGLLGFAYPTLTSAFTGTNPAVDDVAKNQAAYDPFFFNAVSQKLVDPVFTLTLGRGNGSNAGQLALGGLPSSAANKQFASTKLEKMNLSAGTSNFTYYTITPESYTLGGEGTSKAQIPFIVDSGTTLTYFPDSLAFAINNAFDPPSQYIEEEGVFENYCDATPPQLSINIGGTNFAMSAQDLLLTGESGYDSYTGGCVTGVQAAGNQGPFILGETFLRNVVAVFDVGNDVFEVARQ